MKTTKLFFMAALALLMTACSSNDEGLTQKPIEQPAKAEGITITAKLAPKSGGAATRAVADKGDDKITATWEQNEKIAILYEVSGTKYVATANIDDVDAKGVATITFAVEDVTPDDTPCTLVYPAILSDGTTTVYKDDLSGVKAYADMLATQDGVLDGDLDVRVGAGTIQTTTPGLTVNTQPAAQYSIFKFTTQDISGSAITPTEFTVSDAAGNVITTVTLTTSDLYVALPVLTADTYWFNATADSKPYIAKATVSTATSAGTYYQSTVKMATLGDLMGADGKFYANAAAISTASTTAIGVIAYLGTDNFTENGTNVGGSTFVGHGLVLCLKNAASGADAQWSTETSALEFGEDAKVANIDALKRATNVSGYTNTKTLAEKDDADTKYKAAYAAKNYTGLTAPAGTTGWFLPSAQQWVKMQTGLGELDESSISSNSWYDNDHTAANKWETALAKAGDGNYDSMTSTILYYWSSSEVSAGKAVSLGVDARATGSGNGFEWNSGNKDSASGTRRVRPVLAF